MIRFGDANVMVAGGLKSSIDALFMAGSTLLPQVSLHGHCVPQLFYYSTQEENQTYMLFCDIAKQYEGKNVDVLVSGAAKMQEDVATECKHHSNMNNSNVAFHYHSVSFEL
ncbi:hypothetical protein AXG93_4303s1020 [Marchantia polymorpha subsp. ruderalis]|uniref:Uncharacterized protein n=1 Tax=Marchantia polymorpha subsp. ruderalis TaxID=1480154 RepID=A0A176WS52_MARPO|nr:hypothetical protein AXG93_4303s1020 [Marchantia polymorpha subsp. ruderalis]